MGADDSNGILSREPGVFRMLRSFVRFRSFDFLTIAVMLLVSTDAKFGW